VVKDTMPVVTDGRTDELSRSA